MPVWLGASDYVPLVTQEGITVTLSRAARTGMEVKVIYDSPVPAPIMAGDQIAMLEVTTPEGPPIQTPLVAGQDVERLGPLGRIVSGVKFLVFGAP